MGSPRWLKAAARSAVLHAAPTHVVGAVGDLGDIVDCGETLTATLRPRNVRREVTRGRAFLDKVDRNTHFAAKIWKCLRP